VRDEVTAEMTMPRIACGIASVALGALWMSAASLAAPAAASCRQLAALTIPNVTIASATDVPAGPFTEGRSLTVPAFCRVVAVAAPTPDSHINLEVWIPSQTWNGKLLGTDNGGFSGAIGYAAMAAALNRGYATVGTDTGHTGGEMDFGVGHPEKIVDWAYRSVHVMTEVAKLVVRSLEGRFPEHAYFSGCSTGGQQALSEAQRYPADYDGIVAGDPGNDRLNLIYGFLWSWMATHGPDGRTLLPSAKLPSIARAAVAACDAADGVKDGLIGDPRSCHFDPSALACTGVEDDSCLTPPQVAAVKKVYDGAKNPRTGAQIFPGWARGSEQGWGTYITNPREPVRVGLFTGWAFHDPAWDMWTFDFDRDVAYVDAALPFLSAMSTDLGAFKARSGRLIMYTGLADPVVPPQDVINYYDSVARASGGITATQTFFRFFTAPGMAHCGGGVGPNRFDSLGALEAWVERGQAPDVIVASHATNQQIDRTRPLCAYPATARYKGTGSVDDQASFACTTAGTRR
jgi:Tannase and feruloyl esterase